MVRKDNNSRCLVTAVKCRLVRNRHRSRTRADQSAPLTFDCASLRFHPGNCTTPFPPHKFTALRTTFRPPALNTHTIWTNSWILTGRIPTTKVREKGQVTIPKDLRDRLGIGEGTAVTVVIEGDAIVIRKDPQAQTRGQALAQRMSGRGDVTMSTDEIMALTRGEPA